MSLFGNREWINKNKYASRKAELEELFKNENKVYLFSVTNPDGSNADVRVEARTEQAATKQCRAEHCLARADLIEIIYPEVRDTNTLDLFVCNPGQNTSRA